MQTYRVDGRLVKDIPSLCAAFARAVGAPTGSFGNTLFSFDDRFFGGYGLKAPCEILWDDSAISRGHLDSAALVLHCQERLDGHQYLDEEGREWLLATKAKAERGERTLFEVVVDSIATVSARAPNLDWKVSLVLR